MTWKELKRLLGTKGCTFGHGKGHEKVYLNGRYTVIPRHGTDIGPRLLNKIFKDLGLK